MARSTVSMAAWSLYDHDVVDSNVREEAGVGEGFVQMMDALEAGDQEPPQGV